jgi:hypothetical protein
VQGVDRLAINRGLPARIVEAPELLQDPRSQLSRDRV